MGELGANLPQEERDAILHHECTERVEPHAAFDLHWLPFGQQIHLSTPADIAINLQRVDGDVAVHILRYDYDSSKDQVVMLNELDLDLRLPEQFGSVEVFSPTEPPEANLQVLDNIHHLSLKNLPLYSIVLLK